jgi:hypothetical protein
LSLRAYAKHRKEKVDLAGLFRPSKKLSRVVGSSPRTAGSTPNRADRGQPPNEADAPGSYWAARTRHEKAKADLAELDLAKRAARAAVLFNATIWLRRQGFS